MVNLVGAFTQTVVGARASLVDQGITYAAVAFGAAGNDVTIRLLDPGAPDEVLSVSVASSAITVSLATDGSSVITSTANDVIAAIQASTPASALVSVSGSGALALSALVATPLAGGIEPVFTDNLPIPFMVMSQVSETLYRITLADKYNALLSIQMQLKSASPQDLVPQIVSESVLTTKLIDFKLLAAATPSAMSANSVLYVDLKLRNVS